MDHVTSAYRAGTRRLRLAVGLLFAVFLIGGSLAFQAPPASAAELVVTPVAASSSTLPNVAPSKGGDLLSTQHNIVCKRVTKPPRYPWWSCINWTPGLPQSAGCRSTTVIVCS